MLIAIFTLLDVNIFCGYSLRTFCLRQIYIDKFNTLEAGIYKYIFGVLLVLLQLCNSVHDLTVIFRPHIGNGISKVGKLKFQLTITNQNHIVHQIYHTRY